MHGGVRLSLRGGGAGPRPGQAPPGAVWEADDETDDEGDEAMTSEQLRRAKVELLEGVAVVRGDEDRRAGRRDGRSAGRRWLGDRVGGDDSRPPNERADVTARCVF